MQEMSPEWKSGVKVWLESKANPSELPADSFSEFFALCVLTVSLA